VEGRFDGFGVDCGGGFGVETTFCAGEGDGALGFGQVAGCFWTARENPKDYFSKYQCWDSYNQCGLKQLRPKSNSRICR
jgi:hypothetical protein